MERLLWVFAIGFIVTYVICHFYKKRLSAWYVGSDSITPIAIVRFEDDDDRLEIYSRSRGKCIMFKCINHTAVATSTNIMIPRQYNSPYAFIKSGNLDEELRDLRMVAESIKIETAVGFSYNAHHPLRDNSYNKKPLRFKTLTDQAFKTLRLY